MRIDLRRVDWRGLALKLWREWGKPLLVVIVALSSFRSAVADWNDVPSGSMRPTILEGDRIFVNKLAYGLRMPFTDWWLVQWEGPQRGDVVICFSPATGDRLVKRAIGLPGDRVELRHDRLFLNGTPVEYEPLDAETINQIERDQQQYHIFVAEGLGDRTHPVMITPRLGSGRSFGPTTVPAGH